MSYLNYLLFRLFTFPLQFLPYPALHALGKILGRLLYTAYPKYRKRALSNLALATSLNLTSDEIPLLAKKSLENLAITVLEYPRLFRESDISRIASCENPETAATVLQQGKGVIFFVGHQANWEVLFLEGTSRMPGVAIGRPIANKKLYNWTLKLREKFGGTIIEPRGAYRGGVKALKEGKFIGIVGDQGMPDSNFSSPFLGREAWTSPLPALLSKRTGCPIIVATIRREGCKYRIRYSDPIEPREDIEEQMQEVLSLFEKSICAKPHEWLWIHNKWKQQKPGILKKQFRHDAVALIFGSNPKHVTWLAKIRELYPREQLTAFVPEGLSVDSVCELKTYTDEKEILVTDYRFKLVIDFTHNKRILHHFKKLSAFTALSFSHPEEFIHHAR